MSGPAAAQLFYDESRFKRRGVAPRRFQKTLFGKGGVQGLDGQAHRHRKQMFVSLMSPERIARIGELSAQTWQAYAANWGKTDRVVLYDEVNELLMRVACAWAGVPLLESEVASRSRDVTATFDYAGTIGPKHYWARVARKRAESWIEDIIQKCRSGKLDVAQDAALHVVATHRELNGRPLSLNVAAVELLNIVRPIVAVSVYIIFAALALHEYPACRESLRTASDDYPLLFAQEIRRHYPFFPAVGAETRYAFDWNGYHFPESMPVLLDLYGTNHDERTWTAPNEFQPDRFRDWKMDPYNFIPQGGGDQYVNHRCPGEKIAIELLKVAATFFTRGMTYHVPKQDLEIDFKRVPALPRSHFIISDVVIP
jgi:fatty-acid peroxygenase